MVEIPVELINAEVDGAVGLGDSQRLEAMEIEQYVTDGSGEKLSGKGNIGKPKVLRSLRSDDFPYVIQNSGQIFV